MTARAPNAAAVARAMAAIDEAAEAIGALRAGVDLPLDRYMAGEIFMLLHCLRRTSESWAEYRHANKQAALAAPPASPTLAMGERIAQLEERIAQLETRARERIAQLEAELRDTDLARDELAKAHNALLAENEAMTWHGR